MTAPPHPLRRFGAGPLKVVASVGVLILPAHSSAQQATMAPGATSSVQNGNVGDALKPPDTHPTTDGVYGRLDGDLALALSIGSRYVADGFSLGVRGSAHYFDSAGLSVAYSEALEADLPARHLALGIDVRPLFLPRWSQDWERGPAWADLCLDSIALGVGAFWQAAGGEARANTSGIEGSVGLALPLTKRAPGPWMEVRGFRQWPLGVRDSEGAINALWLGFAWHGFVETPLVSPPSD